MILSLIAAMDENHGIGKDSTIPWRLPADLKRFRTLTTGHHIIMGRKTYDSIGHLLPNRTMVIITKNKNLVIEDCLVVHSLSEAIYIVRERGETEAFIIGGGEIFQQFIGLADRIYLTLVHTIADTDTYFPSIDRNDWEIIESTKFSSDDRNTIPSTFSIFERIK